MSGHNTTHALWTDHFCLNGKSNEKASFRHAHVSPISQRRLRCWRESKPDWPAEFSWFLQLTKPYINGNADNADIHNDKHNDNAPSPNGRAPRRRTSYASRHRNGL